MSILDRVSYKPGWALEAYETEFQGRWLKVVATVPNSYRPSEMTTLCVRSPIPPHETDEEFLRWLRWRLERIEVHEVHEWLKLDGRPIFDPHDPRAVEETDA